MYGYHTCRMCGHRHHHTKHAEHYRKHHGKKTRKHHTRHSLFGTALGKENHLN